MKVVVTGGCGFIGSHLVDRLVKEEHEVLIIDDLSTGLLTNLNKHARFEELNINDTKISEIFSNFQPDIVYHLAAQVDVQSSIKDPLFDANINVMGTLNILSQCKKYNVKKIIYSSSAAVYGNPSYLPITEQHDTNPISFYGLSKYVPENYIKLFCDSCSLDYTILRYANAYGERQGTKGEGGVISIFLSKYINNKTPVIFGDGLQTRDFIYVQDIVEANLLAMENGSSQTFNVSTNSPINVNELITTINKISGMEIQAIYKKQRAGDIIDSYLDNKKIIKELGWVQKYSIEQGLKKTYEQLKKQLFSEEV